MKNGNREHTTEENETASSLLLTKSELAEHFRCSERQIDKLTAQGKIPQPIVLGNVRRWPRSVIMEWLKSLA